jgi:hypothetical protein
MGWLCCFIRIFFNAILHRIFKSVEFVVYLLKMKIRKPEKQLNERLPLI